MEKNVFRLRIKQLREDNNLTQKELGKKLGLSDSTINNYESGKRQPEYPTLIKIANFFGVSTDYLVGKDNTWKYDLPEDVRAFILEPSSQTYLAVAEEAKEGGVLPETLKALIVVLVRDAKNRQK